jgi:hypothetical protein
VKPDPHLLLAISGHGYGHLAQCAPVINALWQRLPRLRVTVCSRLERAVIADRLALPFDYRCRSVDPVLPMRSAWQVDVPAARSVFTGFYRDRVAGLAGDRELLGELRPDLLLANIPWRLLQAARQAGVPMVALCSLNWAAIYRQYCAQAGDSGDVLADMWQGYRAADVFLRPEPAMDMPELANTQAIGPLARLGRADRDGLRQRLSLPAGALVVKVTLGGIGSGLPLEHWPRRPDTVWLMPPGTAGGRDDMIDVARLPMAFIDVLASCDAVLTKPGYGTYTEAVCNGVPILTLARPDWPETAGLNAWARRHGRLQEISQSAFAEGRFAGALDALWRQAAPQPPAPVGIEQAVGQLLARLPPG